MNTRGLASIVVLAALQLMLLGGAHAGERDQESLKAYQELLEMSLKEKKGLMFYVNGQTIGGAVSKIDEGFVEVRNQQYGRIIIRLREIDALAAN